MTTPLIIALVATIALGVGVGLLYLQRVRRPRLVTAHLVLALAGVALMALAAAMAPTGRAGPHGAVPLALLVAATAAGYGAWRLPRATRRRGELMLGAHIVLGVAGFFVVLAWAKGP